MPTTRQTGVFLFHRAGHHHPSPTHPASHHPTSQPLPLSVPPRRPAPPLCCLRPAATPSAATVASLLASRQIATTMCLSRQFADLQAFHTLGEHNPTNHLHHLPGGDNSVLATCGAKERTQHLQTPFGLALKTPLHRTKSSRSEATRSYLTPSIPLPPVPHNGRIGLR